MIASLIRRVELEVVRARASGKRINAAAANEYVVAGATIENIRARPAF